MNSPEESALLEDLGKLFGTGGTTISILPEIQRIKFNKNFWNVAFSSFATLTQYVLFITSHLKGFINYFN